MLSTSFLQTAFRKACLPPFSQFLNYSFNSFNNSFNHSFNPFSTQQRRNDIRNVAIIAHVDHGKSTLCEQMLTECGTLAAQTPGSQTIMDSNELEKERGITIVSKICSTNVPDFINCNNGNDIKLHLLDTPGHADFSGEVERVLSMADGCLILVSAKEHVMPQTRYVLSKALDIGLKPVVVVNKCDQSGANPEQAVEAMFDLMCDLGVEDSLLEFPTVYASALNGWASNKLPTDPANFTGDFKDLFSTILENIPGPVERSNEPLKFMVKQLDYNSHRGQIGISNIESGTLSVGDKVKIWDRDGKSVETSLQYLESYTGLGRSDAKTASSGEIVAIMGPSDIGIGYSITHTDVQQIPDSKLVIDEPTLHMGFSVNDSPLSSSESKITNSPQLRNRLEQELLTNIALRVDFSQQDTWRVSGRGVFHLGILIEQMRREGFALTVSKPQVVIREDPVQGKLEPWESVTIEVPTEKLSTVSSILWDRRGEMTSQEERGKITILEYDMTSRSLIGLRGRLMTATNGQLIMNHRFKEYGEFIGDLPSRTNGVLVSTHSGDATAYALGNLGPRGTFFIKPGEKVYEGMVVGESATTSEIVCNPTKAKQLSNMRASGKDETVKLKIPREMTLEMMLEYIDDDEVLDITPVAIRIRKKLLNEKQRKTKKK